MERLRNWLSARRARLQNGRARAANGMPAVPKADAKAANTWVAQRKEAITAFMTSRLSNFRCRVSAATGNTLESFVLFMKNDIDLHALRTFGRLVQEGIAQRLTLSFREDPSRGFDFLASLPPHGPCVTVHIDAHTDAHADIDHVGTSPFDTEVARAVMFSVRDDGNAESTREAGIGLLNTSKWDLFFKGLRESVPAIKQMDLARSTQVADHLAGAIAVVVSIFERYSHRSTFPELIRLLSPWVFELPFDIRAIGIIPFEALAAILCLEGPAVTRDVCVKNGQLLVKIELCGCDDCRPTPTDGTFTRLRPPSAARALDFDTHSVV